MYDVNKTVNIIKTVAKAQGLSTVEMLEHLGLNKNTLSSMSSRGSWVKSDSLARIADYLDVSVDYLLGRTEKSSPSELTENERRIIELFQELTETQQGELIGRASVMTEQNEEQKPMDWAIPPVDESKAVASAKVDTHTLDDPPDTEEHFVEIPVDEV